MKIGFGNAANSADPFASIRADRAIAGGLLLAFVAVVAGAMALQIPWSEMQIPPLSFDNSPAGGAEPAVIAVGQRRAHQIALLVLAVLGAAAAFFRPISLAMQGSTTNISGKIIYFCIYIVFVVSIFYSFKYFMSPSITVLYHNFFGLYTVFSYSYYVLFIFLSTLILFILIISRSRAPIWPGWILLIAYIGVLFLPPLMQPFRADLLPASTLAAIEWHTEAVFGPRTALSLGSEPSHLGYGILLNALLAAFERHYGRLDLGADFHLFQWLNLVFICACALASHLWFPKRVMVAGISILLIAPWVHNTHMGLLFPNQAGWRYLAFPLVMIALAWARNRHVFRSAPVFGALSSACLLWNPETGVAAMAALLVYTGGRLTPLSPRNILQATVLFVGGFLLFILAFQLFHGVFLGFGFDPLGFFGNVLFRMSGVSVGRPLYSDPLALLIALTAMVAVLAGALRWNRKVLSGRALQSAAIGVLIVVWASYYIQQPHPWNLWSYLVPFGPLFAAGLVGALAAPGRPFWVRSLNPSALAFLVLVGPALLLSNKQAFDAVVARYAARPDVPSVPFMGLQLAPDYVNGLRQRAEFLANYDQDAYAFSSNSYVLPRLTGSVRFFPVSDPAFRYASRSGFLAFVERLQNGGPAFILFDDPSAPGGDPLHANYYRVLAEHLRDSYAFVENRSGWTVLRRTAPPAPRDSLTNLPRP